MSNNRRKANKSKVNRNYNNIGRLMPIKVLIERGDQTITFKEILPIENFVNGTGNSGVYLHGYSIHRPYSALQNSAYNGLLNVYNLARVARIRTSVYVPGSSASTPGYTAAKMYRDARDSSPNPFFEGLIQERSVKRGRSWYRYTFDWLPIEPGDYDFFPFTNVMDNGRYGQTNFAAITFMAPFASAYQPEIEFTYTIDFKYLRNLPNISRGITNRPPIKDNRSRQEDDDYLFPLS